MYIIYYTFKDILKNMFNKDNSNRIEEHLEDRKEDKEES